MTARPWFKSGSCRIDFDDYKSTSVLSIHSWKAPGRIARYF